LHTCTDRLRPVLLHAGDEDAMPIYEYACRDCDQHVEVVQSFRDDPLTECPNCSGRLRKVYGATGIIFKGSGYYVTDSRKAAAKAAKGDGEAAKAKAGETAAKEPAPESGSAKESGKAESSASAGSGERPAKSA
jgi:putative FmdB family regulatory protein